jgi:hypothetical protein
VLAWCVCLSLTLTRCAEAALLQVEELMYAAPVTGSLAASPLPPLPPHSGADLQPTSRRGMTSDKPAPHAEES